MCFRALVLFITTFVFAPSAFSVTQTSVAGVQQEIGFVTPKLAERAVRLTQMWHLIGGKS